ncbi:MAG: hypothetical protein CMM18_00510 [Rhodospirillaceae bacterium]|nr:hypothetical protein [Rhodospirillaceae bacterium]
MKLRIPIVKTSLDISSWFLVRGRSAGKEITHRKLQYLMYLAYGNYFIEKFDSKLIPVTFILSKVGPIEPNIFQLFGKVNLADLGNDLPGNVEKYLLNIWKKFEDFESDELELIITKNKVWGQISLQPIGTQITDDLIIKSFVNDDQIKKNIYNNIVDDEKEYWTLSGKKAERWIPGLSKKNK